MDKISIKDLQGNPIKNFYQWDLDQKVVFTGIQSANCVDVHFCNYDSKEALVVTPDIDGDRLSACVPNILLQHPKPVIIYIYCTDENTGSRTTHAVKIVVVPRPRPADYAYTETEVLCYRELDKRIKALESLDADSVTKNELQEILEDALASKLHVPPAAAVGQYFRVAAVDENNIVTAVEAVDAPKGGDTVTDEQITQAVSDYMAENPVEGGKGEPGEPGADGKDGFSPTVTVGQTENGAVITITDKNGTTTATVANGKDGADGAPGEKGDKGDTGATGPAGAAGKDGKDYVLTASDKAEIVQAVLDELGGQPVRGVVDENNNIVISGSLADGTYTLKYENADGTYTEIGTFDVGKVGPAYTNLFDPASATLNQRWSNSNFAYKAENGIVVSDYIPITIPSDADNPSVLRWRGGSMTGNAGLIYFNSSKTVINASDASTNGAGLHSSDTSFTTDVNGDGMVYLGFKNGSLQSNWQTSAAYIRLSLYVGSSALTLDDIQNIIITIDEPIVD